VADQAAAAVGVSGTLRRITAMPARLVELVLAGPEGSEFCVLTPR
jgi:hypothetical protein